MDSVELIRRLNQHRLWVNHELLLAVEDLSGDQLHESYFTTRSRLRLA